MYDYSPEETLDTSFSYTIKFKSGRVLVGMWKSTRGFNCMYHLYKVDTLIMAEYPSSTKSNTGPSRLILIKFQVE